MEHLIVDASATFDRGEPIRSDGPTVMLVCDPDQVERIRAERRRDGHDWRDEVWDGIYVMSPSPNVEHQWIAGELHAILRSAIRAIGGRAFQVINISDRDQGWEKNYREPDVSVYLAGNPARNRGTHWEGGGDFVVEILSRGDLARSKRTFYAKVGVREFLIVDREPWALELYRAHEGQLELVGTSTPEGSGELASEVLPLSFRLIATGGERPTIEVARVDGGERWMI